MKTKLGLLYGGKSAEHEVSLQTALAVIKALDLEKFDIHPIYITKEGNWVKGQQLTKPAESVAELAFSDENQGSSLLLQRKMISTMLFFLFFMEQMVKTVLFKDC